MKTALKILKISGVTILGLVLLIVILLGALTLWLTPQRLGEIANREASRYLNAEILTGHISYTLWSSFPRLYIHTDSITVISKNLQDLSPEIRRQLPADADSLGSLKTFSGGINIVDLFLNRYVIHDIKVDGLNLNLVAFNDSINNYNILPHSGQKMKSVPYISAHLISLRNPGALKYFSAASNTRASVQLSQLTLSRANRHDNTKTKDLYHLGLNGRVTASSAGISILSGFPFSLAGDMQLRFHPFGVMLKDYTINLGKIHSKLTMSVGMGDNPAIDKFNYRISSVNLMSLLGYIPKEFMPSLQAVQADVAVSASAELTSAWNFSSETFPSIKVDFAIPEGTMDYSVALPTPGSKGVAPASHRVATIPLRYSRMEGIFFFDGAAPERSYLDIPQFTLASEGVDIGIKAYVSNLTGRPLVKAAISLNSDLRQTFSSLPLPTPFSLSGKLALATDIDFNISDFSKEGLQQGLLNLRASGHVDIRNAHLKMPDYNLDLHLDRLNASIQENIASLSASEMANANARGDIRIAGITADLPQGRGRLTDLHLRSSAAIGGIITPQRVRDGIPFRLSASAAQAAFTDSAATLSVKAENITISDLIARSTISSLRNALSDGVSLRAENLDMLTPTGNFTAEYPSLSLSITQNPDSTNLRNQIASAQSEMTASDGAVTEEERQLLDKIDHSPVLIAANLPEAIRNLLTGWNFTTSFKASRILLHSQGLHDDDYIANLDLSLDNDSFHLANADVMLEKTRAHLRADASNLRNFLLFPAAERNPLDIKLNLALDTVNINALAHAYVDSKGGMKNIPTHPSTTASDSTALLIPRNIRADLTLSARETVYTNLRLFDLQTNVLIDHGVLDIPNLAISSDFGKGALNVNYNSSNLEKMHMRLGAELSDINIVNFFKNFHTLLLMMPQMKNLTGMLSVGVQAEGDIFPDMYLNMPSVSGEANVKGWNLNVHQDKFIRKITKMMLIRTDDDIHIADLDVHAAIHDNLLQLDPFNFEFDRYRINMTGINNFYGKLYYHIAVLKSPVPFPFSINIDGMFHDPKLRFGGPKYDLRHSEEITSDIEENNNVNMVTVLHQFLRAFIKKAAESAENS